MSEPKAYRWSVDRRIGYPAIVDLALSPDGRHILYTMREPLMTDEKSEFITHLYLATTKGGEPIQLTFGEYANRCPRWSPDGRYVAFLSKRTGKTNAYVMRVDGGEAWAVTRYEKTDVTSLRWSPDGRSIGFLMAEPPSEEKEKARKAKDDAIQWDFDFDFAHLFVVPFAVGPRTLPEPLQITRGRYHVVDFDWLPDGKRIAFTHRPNPGADCWTETRLGIIASDGSAVEPTDFGSIGDFGGGLSVSPDGRWIACPTGDRPVRWGFSNRPYLYPVDGGDPRALAYTSDDQCFLPGWSPDGSEIYVGSMSGTTSQIWALPVTGDAGREVTESALLKWNPVVGKSGHIAFVGEDFDQPNAVYLLNPTSGETFKVVQPPLPRDWPDAPLPQAEVVRWTSRDGLTIEGVLIYPSNYEPGNRYPLVVSVHGGPAGVFGRSYLGTVGGYADVAGLTERGYAVLRPNPRGSSGYGRAFRFANYGDWGGGDYEDIMNGVDALIARGVADPDRLGIIGWSYGGFMTSWAITQTDRFKAACVGAGVTDLVSFNGTSDIPGFVPDYFSAEFWDNLETYRQHSPVLNAKRVRTPTLIQHGDQDVRVPLGQGRELYNALKRQGVPVEMVIYPRQGHLVEEPRLLMDVVRRATEWLDRWIGR